MTFVQAFLDNTNQSFISEQLNRWAINNKSKIIIDSLVNEILHNLKENPIIKDIIEVTVNLCNEKKSLDTDYGKLATFIFVEYLHSMTTASFSKFMSIYYSYTITSEFINKYSKELDAMIIHNNDYLYDYNSIKMMIMQFYIGEHERPQYLHMRVAVALFADNTSICPLSLIKSYYEGLSNLRYINATPTLYNACSNIRQYASCFLFGVDDNIESITNTIKNSSIVSAKCGGIGIHMHSIRGSGALIKSNGGTSNGIIPMLKIFESSALCWNQGGKRKGAMAFWIEMWHRDIEQFLELKNIEGDEQERCRHLFLGLWMCDLFIERVNNEEQWSLFDDNTAPGLTDLYGDQFNIIYKKYEKEGRAVKTVSARTIFDKLCVAITNNSGFYVCYKDHINKKSNQKNIGVIKSSNLCTEIMEYSSATSYASCIIATMVLKNYIVGSGSGSGSSSTSGSTSGSSSTSGSTSTFNFELFIKDVRAVVRALDNLISRCIFPVKECIQNANEYRPIAVGLQGLADTFAKLHIPFLSKEAAFLDKKIAETLYYAAVSESCQLAKERGAYSRFDGSPMSQGIMQFDMWDNVETVYDWTQLRADVKKYGVRNSLLVAYPPTASTSRITGSNETVEAFTSNIYIQTTLSGKYPIVNSYMVDHLNSLGIWNQSLMDKVTRNGGSIQSILEIPLEIREIYKIVTELSSTEIYKRIAIRSAFIDQSSSNNYHAKNKDPQAVAALLKYTHKLGLKTAIYYYRAAARQAITNYIVCKKELGCVSCQ